LIQNAADVLEMVRPSAIARVASPAEPYHPVPSEPGEDERRAVEGLLGPSPVPVDELVRLSGLPSGAVQLVLLELDLAGRIDRHAGGKVSMAPA
jgi:DNA processing protein